MRVPETKRPIAKMKLMRGWMLRAGVAMLAAGMVMPLHAEERAIKSRVSPVYPEIAKRMRVSGVVKLNVTVDAEGKVQDVKAVSGNSMLSTAAEEAVRKWKFEPGAGQATVSVSINFDLAQ